jgi:hypothetical protein
LTKICLSSLVPYLATPSSAWTLGLIIDPFRNAYPSSLTARTETRLGFRRREDEEGVLPCDEGGDGWDGGWFRGDGDGDESEVVGVEVFEKGWDEGKKK